MNSTSRLRSIRMAAALLLAAPPALAVDAFHKIGDLNYYEWTAVAPVVVAGTSLGENGRFVEFRVQRALRGEIETGSMIRVDLKQANRDRRRSDYPFSLKLLADVDYLLVLKTPFSTKDGMRAFPLARGVLSARELPEEAQQGILDAVALFLETQDYKDDRVIWDRMGDMLERTNPLVLATALQQFSKFRRATVDHLPSLRPLLDHPDALIREGAARVIGQVVGRAADTEVPEEEALLAELIGVARRDEFYEPRIAATEALAAFGVARVEAVLEEVAATDPEQLVRYAAERILLDYRKTRAAEAARPRLDPDAH